MNRILFIVLLSQLFSCKSEGPDVGKLHNPIRDQKEFRKIDFHSHYRFDRECLEQMLNDWSMKTVLVDVAAMDPAQNEEKWLALKKQYNKYPDRYYLCASFAALNIDDPAFATSIINKLEKDFEDGAVMVKVWKVHGMEIKDKKGDFVQIDDPRMQPIWDFLIEKDIPVMAHIAEPLQAWLPLEEGNPHYNYYKNNPQYHAYLHPEIPSWQTIINARDHWIEKNPGLRIIAAHMGSMAYDIHLVSDRLDKYPNMFVEPAARFGDLTNQNSDSVRSFFIKYQDRILYGTDLGISSPADGKTSNDCDYHSRILTLHWRYFTEKDSIYYDSPMISFPVKTRGLDLPDSVLRKIYYDNALNLLGGKL